MTLLKNLDYYLFKKFLVSDWLRPSVCRYQPQPSASVDNGKLRA
jgi:hypothetical protein